MSAQLPGPVMVASGCGGTGRELEAFAGAAGIAGLHLVTRSITLDARPGGAAPRVAEVPGGLVNAVGLPNPGLEHFLATELPWLVRAGVQVTVSIAGATLGEYADLARRLSRAPGVVGLEVNVGAPDDAGTGLFEVREPYHSASVVAAVRREFPSDRPLLAKLRPDVSRIVEGARACHEAGASAVVIGNSVPAAFPDGRAGGLSGPAIAPIALRCVAAVRAALPDVPTVGSGGVRDLASARAYLDAGALAVQVGTALLHDPTTVARLRADLAEETP
ncbi:dihydroorotate dehydrogenase [Nocardioides hwasunensis]|uniref:Dihydroorotate dehydrogenase n=1 Tax=Nocardioides hwasunensis TaxID=397258 RepID=A0ABR8MEW8_9ACTN|nr:dihydroorotate dehydrogenase [Nocardioides hwasunensis]MBD3914507.1 dihydroorotate dehydrogenase [Nocardioides hwasunensis]